VKKNFARSLLLGIACAAFGVSCATVGMRGNGHRETFEETGLAAFEKIEITAQIFPSHGNWSLSDGKAIVRLHSSEEYRLKVAIDSNLRQYVNIGVADNALKIETTERLEDDFTVDVYSPRITGVSIDYIGRVETADTIHTPSFSMDINGAGELDGDITCEDFSVVVNGAGELTVHVESEVFSAEINGAGKLTVTGASQDARISIPGAGTFNGKNFATNNASVRMSGAGTAVVWAIDNLAISVSGVGNIRYRGKPTVNFHRGGLGGVENIE
jgi:hypothetical protein